MVIKLLQLFLTKKKLLLAQSLWQVHYQITEEIYNIKCKDHDCTLAYGSVKDNLININAYFVINIIQTS